jgi:hypothetical protein
VNAWLARPLPYGLWLATCFVIGLLFAGGVLLYGQIRGNRVSAIERLCDHDNANAQHNVDFLRRLHVGPRTMLLAQETFKQTPDCHAFAVRTVKVER